MSKHLSEHFSIKVDRANKIVRFIVHDHPSGNEYFAELSDPDGSIGERMRAAFTKELSAQPDYDFGKV